METTQMNSNYEIMIPVIFNGDLKGIVFSNEEVNLTKKDISDLYTLGVRLDNGNNFEGITTFDDAIKCLFVMNRRDDAWRLINEHIEDINFGDIATYEHFIFDRSATDTFKYLYCHNLIDDSTYAYFNVISGEFFDKDFEIRHLGGCTTIAEILETVYNDFNGVNPLEFGLIKYDSTLQEMINDVIMLNKDKADKENLDSYIVGSRSAVDFKNGDFYNFISHGYVSSEKMPMLLRTMYEIAISDNENTEQMTECNNAHNNALGAFYNMNDIIELYSDTLQYTEYIIEKCMPIIAAKSENKDEDDYYHCEYDPLTRYIITADAFIVYPNTILKYADQLDYYIASRIAEHCDYCITDMIRGKKSYCLYNFLTQNAIEIDGTEDCYIFSGMIPSQVKFVYCHNNHELYIGIISNNEHKYSVLSYEPDDEGSIDKFIDDAGKLCTWALNELRYGTDDYCDDSVNNTILNMCSSFEEYHELGLSIGFSFNEMLSRIKYNR